MQEKVKENGNVSYGINQLTGKEIILNRKQLTLPHGFFLGNAGSGKSYLVKLEIMSVIENTTDEIHIIGLAQEYQPFAKKIDGNAERIFIYDMDKVENCLQTQSMLNYLDHIYKITQSNGEKGLRTRIYIDEIFPLFKSEHSIMYLYEIYKRLRNIGGIFTGITQDVDTMLRSETARNILARTEFVVMLSSGSITYEKFMKLIKLFNNISPENSIYISDTRRGSGLIYAGNLGTFPFDYSISEDDERHKILSTRFTD